MWKDWEMSRIGVYDVKDLVKEKNMIKVMATVFEDSTKVM